MLAFVIQNQPHRTGADLGRELVCRFARHGSTFSRVGASDQPGAVQIGEDDLTHRDEILSLNDFEWDRESERSDYDFFRKRSLDNYHNRCLHHHVFNAYAFVRMLNAARLQLSGSPFMPPRPCPLPAIRGGTRN